MPVHNNNNNITIVQPLTANEKERNPLIAQVFHLLALLVSFGYYDDDKDVKELLPDVISCLDGKRKSEKSMSTSNASNSYILMQH